MYMSNKVTLWGFPFPGAAYFPDSAFMNDSFWSSL